MGPPEAVGPRKKSGVSAPVCGPACNTKKCIIASRIDRRIRESGRPKSYLNNCLVPSIGSCSKDVGFVIYL